MAEWMSAVLFSAVQRYGARNLCFSTFENDNYLLLRAQYGMVQYGTVQHSTVQYSIPQHSTS